VFMLFFIIRKTILPDFELETNAFHCITSLVINQIVTSAISDYDQLPK
jgi:hypothetical protein